MQRKKLIALAVSSLVAGPAFAQSNVTIYGIADFGLVSRAGSSGDALPDFNGKTEFVSGVQSGSRIGFKGSEALGNNLKAIFEIEFGTKIDEGTTSSVSWGNRHSWVGLAGNFGTLVGGRIDGIRYNIINKYDPFVAGTVGQLAQMMPQVDREDNALLYISPSWSGLSLVLSYSTNIAGTEGANNNQGSPCTNHCFGGNDFDNRLAAVNLNYDNGPISLSADYERVTTVGNGDNTMWTATFGASYDFGVVKLMAAYDKIKADPGVGWNGVFNSTTGSGIHDQTSWMVGLSAPIGSSIVARAAYVDSSFDDAYGVKNVKDFDAGKWSIGADYNFSKRTNLYFDYAQINNDDNGLTALTYAGSVNGVTAQGSGAAYGTRGFDIGIRHKF